jgi:hypothetical protein
MRTYAQGAQELIRRLVANAAAENGAAGMIGHPHHLASERVCRGLSRSLGAEGSAALLTRAILQAEVAHPLLRDIRVGRGDEPILGGLDELVALHGNEKVDAALESMLTTMLALLGRLIGKDMVPRLLEPMARVETKNQDAQ